MDGVILTIRLTGHIITDGTTHGIIVHIMVIAGVATLIITGIIIITTTLAQK